MIMDLRAKIESSVHPVSLYELIPPKAGDKTELEESLALVRKLVGSVDGINIPEIRDETRQGERRSRLPERIEPRAFALAIRDSCGLESVVNRVTVHETGSRQVAWMAQSHQDYGIRNLILVGGESHAQSYPGPGVPEAAALTRAAGIDFCLGGISIPSRSQEAARVRKKYAQGLRFFTTQVLLDSNDIVDLIQSLNGLDVWIFLSFAPMSDLRDVEFLRWLGVDVSKNVEWSITQAGEPAKAVEKTIAHAAKILTDVFDHLPSHPPGLGINIEQITQRNHQPATQMLETIGEFYRHLLQARGSALAGARHPAR